MKKVDFYSGEPSFDGSPPITQDEAMIAAAQMQSINSYVSQQKQSNNNYSYDPLTRQALQFQGQNNGYFNPYQQQPYHQGIGYPAAPSYYNPNFQQQQFYNQYQQQSILQQPTSRTISIPGYNPSGEFLFSNEDLEKLEQMKLDYIRRRREIEVKNQAEQNTGYNYYGSPFYTGTYFKIRELDQEFYQKIEEIEQEARERRKQFNLRMGRLAHKAAHEKMSEETLLERYNGREITIEAPEIQNFQETYGEAYKLANLVEIDTTIPYVNAFNQIREQHAKYVDPNADAKHAFENYGLLEYEYEEEKRTHEMRNLGNNYSSSSYSRLMKQKILERETGYKQQQVEEFINPPEQGFIGYPLNPNMAQFPTLAKNAHLADDGTLHITCNFGSHNGEVLAVHNSQEAEYEKDRERFNAFLASIPDANSLGGDG